MRGCGDGMCRSREEWGKTKDSVGKEGPGG